jgi:Bacterial Ig domain/Domain of unknown function DUF11/Bacterial Ig-like domain (group 3)
MGIGMAGSRRRAGIPPGRVSQWRSLRAGVAAGALVAGGVIAVPALWAMPAFAAQDPECGGVFNLCSVSFTTPGTGDSFTVPPGVTSLAVTLTGGTGGYDIVTDVPGGDGAEVLATLAVSPGEVLGVDVGGAGGGGGGSNSGGTNGGGSAFDAGAGGGFSDVTLGAGGTRLLVAGGGGGAGDFGALGDCDALGGPGMVAGGPGGNADSPGGTGGAISGSGYSIGGGGGGGAGTATGAGAGGAGGTASGTDPCPPPSNFFSNGRGGAAGSGPDGGSSGELGGGGGGGYFGGGSGGNPAEEFSSGSYGGYGGGGGGSSYTGGTGVSNATVDDEGNPSVGGSGNFIGNNGSVLIAYTDPVSTGSPAYSTMENTTLNVSAGTGLLSPTAGTTVPSGGTAAASGPAATTQGGSLTVNSDGSFGYTPPAGFTGADTFTYTVTDGSGDTATGSATITVTAPTATTTTLAPASAPVASDVTLTATVAPPPGGGTVAFSLDGNPITGCGAQPVGSGGQATCQITAPTSAAAYPVTAAYSGTAGYAPSTGTGTLTTTPGPVASLTLSPASATIAAGGSQSYTATGFDQYGNLTGDVTAQTTFTISGTGSCTAAACTATVAGGYTVTGADGAATGADGAATGTAALTVTPGPAATVTASGGDNQSATTGQAFAAPLSVTVTDAYGNPVGGATVTFTIVPGGGTAGFGGTAQTVTAVTTAAGVATSPALDAGSTAGPVTITATTPGASGVAGTSFMETVTSSGPARADLKVAISVPATLARGATGTVTVTVTNNGPSTAANVATGLYVPPSLTITGAGGGTVYYGVDVFKAASLAAGAKLTCTVTVEAGQAKALALLIAATGSATRDPSLLNNITAALIKIT